MGAVDDRALHLGATDLGGEMSPVLVCYVRVVGSLGMALLSEAEEGLLETDKVVGGPHHHCLFVAMITIAEKLEVVCSLAGEDGCDGVATQGCESVCSIARAACGGSALGGLELISFFFPAWMTLKPGREVASIGCGVSSNSFSCMGLPDCYVFVLGGQSAKERCWITWRHVWERLGDCQRRGEREVYGDWVGPVVIWVLDLYGSCRCGSDWIGMHVYVDGGCLGG